MSGVLVAVTMGWMAAFAAADASLERLVEQADAIVLVEIRSTDARAMPSDGPMKVEAKIVKVLKGRLREGAMIRFDASAWMGPTYEPLERRIVFLKRSTAEGIVAWASIEVGWLDLFFTDEEMASCSLEALTGFLDSLGRQSPRPRLQFRAHPAEINEHLLVPDNDRHCQNDSDCASIPTHCGGCTCGTAIDRRWEGHYQEALRFLCEGKEGPVCDMHCPQQLPRCIDGRCQ